MIALISVYSDAVHTICRNTAGSFLLDWVSVKNAVLICSAKELLDGSVSFVMFDVNGTEKHNDLQISPKGGMYKEN